MFCPLDDKTCKDVIERYSKKELNVCPHTSCAIFGLESYLSSPSLPSSPSSKYVCLATADPAKFLDETKELYTTPVVIPEGLGKLEGDEVKTRKRGCEPEVEALKKLISESLEKKDGGDLVRFSFFFFVILFLFFSFVLLLLFFFFLGLIS